MLAQHTIERLRQLRLKGMAEALQNQARSLEFIGLTFEEQIGILIDCEYTHRQNRRLARLLTDARLKLPACIEDIDYQQSRGLDRSLIRDLSSCYWIESHLHVLITGPSGVGKSYLACALGNAACRHGLKTRYYRLSLLFSELAIARGDGSYSKMLNHLSRYDLLILDDWALSSFSLDQSRDLLEIVESRNEKGSLLIASQIPIDSWYQALPDPTLADAILDRIVHTSYKILLTGESMRKIGAGKRLSKGRQTD